METYFHITELALDHLKGMFGLGPSLGFEVFDFVLGLVKQAMLIQFGISAAPSCDLPNHLAPLILVTLLDTGVARRFPRHAAVRQRR